MLYELEELIVYEAKSDFKAMKIIFVVEHKIRPIFGSISLISLSFKFLKNIVVMLTIDIFLIELFIKIEY